MYKITVMLFLGFFLFGCQPQVNYNRPVPSPGPKGDVGPIGPQGPVGQDGSGCTVETAVGGALIKCADGTHTLILNGATGIAGHDAAPTAYTVTEIIDPCGHQTAFDEVLLRMANNQLIAHFASGANQFLTLVGPGNYSTTDGTSCHFTIHPDLSVTW